MKLLFAGSEMTPYAKTGGLADVLGALPSALAGLGHEVVCCLPYYRTVRAAAEDARSTGIRLNVWMGSNQIAGDVLESQLSDRLRVLFVRRDEFFDRTELYHNGGRDFPDNARRFVFFSKAVAEVANSPEFQPDIVHCHDWQTGLVPALLHRRVKSVFTIHNIAYQGVFPGTDFGLTNLPPEFFTPSTLEFYGQLNLMKAGIVFADAVTTVSRKYAQEILGPEFGWGLDPVLRTRQNNLTGIVNGADYRTWDPAVDPLIKENFDVKKLDGKKVCRADLLKSLGLRADDTTPVVGVISRLTGQKGIDLIVGAAENLLNAGLVLGILGSGEERYERLLRQLATRFPARVALRLGHNEALAHQIQAGADMLLVPSQFEPCGLTQMYALKYGTIPVVRATGGLDDTVTGYDPATEKGTGFKFTEYTPAALADSVRQAVALYRKTDQWRKLVRRAMACDFSWQASARQYEKLYATL